MFLGYDHFIYLFNLGTQEGDTLSSILDTHKVKALFDDLRVDIFNDIPDLQVLTDFARIQSFEVLSISSKELTLQLCMSCAESKKHSFKS